MYQIENECLSVIFDGNAGISGILDKRIGREYITAKTGINACRVMLPNKSWDGRFADTAKQDIRNIEEKDHAISFTFPGLTAEDGKKTNVTLIIHYWLSGDEIYASYEIQNDDVEETVSHIMFPIVSGIEKETVDGELVMPEQSSFGDTRVTDPFCYGDGNHKDWIRGNNRKECRYPQFLVTAWMDYSDEKGGICFEQRSENFDICDFGFERMVVKDRKCKDGNEDFLRFAMQSYPLVESKMKTRSPLYVIGVHEKNWQVPAFRHRVWLKEHVQLPQVSERFKRSLGWHFFFMKQQDGTVYFKYQDLPRMAEAAGSAGLQNMMVFGWYYAGHDNEYPFGYYVNDQWGGQEELLKRIHQCNEKGCAVIPFFNGTLLDISTEGYRKYGKRWPVLGRTGKPYCGTEFSRANTDMGFSNACIATTTRNMTLLDICITAWEVKAWWKETVLRIVKEYGFHNLQLDQIAHKAYVCYDKCHKHKEPKSAYTQELMELLMEVRRIVKGENPEGIMIGEGMTDLAMQYCDGFWNWHQAYNRPEIIRYSVPWLNYSHEIDANEYDAANLCFAERILLDLKVEGGNGIITDYPEFCSHLKRLSDLKKEVGPAYIEGEYFYQDSIRVEADKGVAVRLYRTRDQVAVVAANTTDKEQTGKVDLDERLRDVKVRSINRKMQRRKSEIQWKFELGPFEVMVMEGNVPND